MIIIDGASGEGGGQILRSSLAMSIATGKPFRIENIRARREKPGLMRQHLTCVNAAAAVCGAEVAGATIGSQVVQFTPRTLAAGQYHFPIGTAGGIMLVLQAVLPALLRAEGPSTVIVEGGTHNTAAPPYEFFGRVLVPLMNRAGANITTRLEKHGFYPAGGGRIVVEIGPSTPTPLALLERGQPSSARGIIVLSRLPRSIARRELDVLGERLTLDATQELIIDGASHSPGNSAAVELCYANVTEVFSGVGELGKPAESVAREVADEARAYIAAGHPVGEYLADQLMVPLAMLAGGRYATGPLSLHATTNIATIAAFGGRVEASADGIVTVEPLSA